MDFKLSRAWALCTLHCVVSRRIPLHLGFAGLFLYIVLGHIRSKFRSKLDTGLAPEVLKSFLIMHNFNTTKSLCSGSCLWDS